MIEYIYIYIYLTFQKVMGEEQKKIENRGDGFPKTDESNNPTCSKPSTIIPNKTLEEKQNSR